MIEDVPSDQAPLLLYKQKPPFESTPQEKYINLDNPRDAHVPVKTFQLITFGCINANAKLLDESLRQQSDVSACIKQRWYVRNVAPDVGCLMVTFANGAGGSKSVLS